MLEKHSPQATPFTEVGVFLGPSAPHSMMLLSAQSCTPGCHVGPRPPPETDGAIATPPHLFLEVESPAPRASGPEVAKEPQKDAQTPLSPTAPKTLSSFFGEFPPGLPESLARPTTPWFPPMDPWVPPPVNS